jgi:hypothetical protein
VIAVLGKFVNPYQPFGSIAIRLEPKMTANLERFIIGDFRVPLAVECIKIEMFPALSRASF